MEAVSSKRRVKVAVKDDNVQWIIVKFKEDGILSQPMKLQDTVCEETGQDGNEANFSEGDHCLAKYADGHMYPAKIILRTDDKEKALRDRKVLARANVTSDETKNKKTKKKQLKNPAETNVPLTEGENTSTCTSAKKKKKELAVMEKQKKLAQAETMQSMASMLFNTNACKVSSVRLVPSFQPNRPPANVPSKQHSLQNVTKARSKVTETSSVSSTCASETETENIKSKSYYPKTRPRLEFAKYYQVDPEKPEIKEGYQLLSPGGSIAVSSLWLHSALSSVQSSKRDRQKNDSDKKHKGKTASLVVKHLMDGFFGYEDLCVKGGSKAFLDTPIFKSLRSYAEHNLKMSAADFITAWNEKMSAARKTKKRLG